MKTLAQQVAEAGLASDKYFIQENLGSYLGLSYNDVWNVLTNKPRVGWRIIGGKCFKNGVQVVFERELYGQKAIFHIPNE